MPNYRNIIIDHGPDRFRISLKPIGVRGLPILKHLLPYLTGNEARIEVKVEVLEWAMGSQRWIEYNCGLKGEGSIEGGT